MEGWGKGCHVNDQFRSVRLSHHRQNNETKNEAERETIHQNKEKIMRRR